MSATAEAPAETSAETSGRAAELEGLVDNATETRLYGWAWNAADPQERLAVELRLADAVVARTTAERMREDLAKAGVGDGRHAFELPLRPEWTQRYRELNVVVRAADGSEAPLPMRARRVDIDPTGALARVMEATATAHRQLREDMQRIADRIPRPDPAQEAAVRALAESQAALDAKLDTLTIWLTRLDERLAAVAAPVARAPRRRAEAWVVALGAVLLAVAAGAGLGTWVLGLG
jgi:hypothetical protein